MKFTHVHSGTVVEGPEEFAGLWKSTWHRLISVGITLLTDVERIYIAFKAHFDLFKSMVSSPTTSISPQLPVEHPHSVIVHAHFLQCIHRYSSIVQLIQTHRAVLFFQLVTFTLSFINFFQQLFLQSKENK